MDATISHPSEAGLRARRRVAYRLLPFVFLLYVVNYIDRVNVSFASLRMNSDLGLSDRAYGLGVGMFYLTYVLFEIPGALMVERWSARKWIARIMVSWGAVTIATGFIHTTSQFYLARFFLGLAEASFFPGMIVYLTHWFTARDRCRALAFLYSAVPAASLVGAPVAGWLLGANWLSLAGWRWLFILEGIPAIGLGIVTLFYLTDWPAQALWLPRDERDWLVTQLDLELKAKKQIRDYGIIEAFADRRILILTASSFLFLVAGMGNIYWLPTFVKRLSGLPNRTVTSLIMVPAILGIAGNLITGWHSDRTGERRWHTAVPLITSGAMYALAMCASREVPLAVLFLLLGAAAFYPSQPVFWTIPTMILSESAAAATFGLINMVGQLGGFAGPYLIGFLNDRTHSLNASFAFESLAFLAAGFLILKIRVRDPLEK
jgi:ACS family tartrate transporter-like MFS transporter